MSTANILQTCRKIICVGRNFASHAKELKNEIPKNPVLFLKPPSSLILHPSPIHLPTGVSKLHPEVELGIVIDHRISNINPSNALKSIKGFVLALDMTARDLQDEAKRKGLPWSVAKGYDTFCPVSNFIPKNKIKNPNDVNLWLKVNGKMRQSDSTRNMIFNCESLISYISSIFTLEENDIILTGTPAGVDAVNDCDIITAGIEGIEESQIEFRVKKKDGRHQSKL